MIYITNRIRKEFYEMIETTYKAPDILSKYVYRGERRNHREYAYIYDVYTESGHYQECSSTVRNLLRFLERAGHTIRVRETQMPLYA